MAAENGHVEVIKALAELGADINAKDENGKTPLYCAAMSGQNGITLVLLCLNIFVDSVKVLKELGASMK